MNEKRRTELIDALAEAMREHREHRPERVDNAYIERLALRHRVNRKTLRTAILELAIREGI